MALTAPLFLFIAALAASVVIRALVRGLQGERRG